MQSATGTLPLPQKDRAGTLLGIWNRLWLHCASLLINPQMGRTPPGPSFHSYLSEFIMRKSVTLNFSMATWYKDPTPRKRPWCWERLKAGEEGDRGIRWSGGIINSRDTSLSKLQDIVQNREAWQATVHGITKSLTRLSDWTPSYNYRLQLKFTIKNLNLNADKNH